MKREMTTLVSAALVVAVGMWGPSDASGKEPATGTQLCGKLDVPRSSRPHYYRPLPRDNRVAFGKNQGRLRTKVGPDSRIADFRLTTVQTEPRFRSDHDDGFKYPMGETVQHASTLAMKDAKRTYRSYWGLVKNLLSLRRAEAPTVYRFGRGSNVKELRVDLTNREATVRFADEGLIRRLSQYFQGGELPPKGGHTFRLGHWWNDPRKFFEMPRYPGTPQAADPRDTR